MKSYMAPGTASRGPGGPGAPPETARPMTSVKGAGFTSKPNKFDPLNQTRKDVAALLKKTDASPEEQAKDLEKKVHEILEQSALLTKKEDYAAGLEKAMEAKKRERALNKYRESNNMADQVNVDLTYVSCQLVSPSRSEGQWGSVV